MPLSLIYKLAEPANQNKESLFRQNQNPETTFLPIHVPTTTSTNAANVSGNLIKHELIDALGHTTNILIYAFFSNNSDKKFARVDVRNALINHKKTLENQGMEMQHLARLRTGKATVNYWIDRLVEKNTLEKKHSNPVVFWINKPDLIKTTISGQKQNPFVKTMEQW
jgi:hypothetical protein